MENEKWKMKSYRLTFSFSIFTLLFWLGCQDSNLGMPESKSGALPLGDSPKCPRLAQKVRMAFYKS